ncbi:MAG: hypothetical protein FJX65_18970 [Alphaproteobacteria bacterium]|nr:hypothetical protein [Alphaproteobacteria bacterium]
MGWRVRSAQALVIAQLATAGPVLAQPADTIRVGDVLGAPSGEPTFSTRSPFSYMLGPIYDALALVNADGSYSPLLATEWRNTDATTWVYRLRPNVKFHNGEMLDSSGIAAYLTWLNSDAGKATNVGAQVNQIGFDSARAIDPLTVEIKSKTPNPLLPKIIQSFWMPAPKAWAELGKEGFAKKPVGSGSYRVTEWGPNGTDYEAFGDSWRPARTPKLSVQKIPDRTARRSAIISGQLDIAQGMDMDDIPVVEGAGHKVDFAPRPQVATLKLISVSRDTPFKDKRVRQAANLAIDRKNFVEHIFRGRTRPANQCSLPGATGYDAGVPPIPFDPTRARQLLAEAGFTNGFETTVHAFAPSPFPGLTDVNQLVSQQLGAIGIKVALEPLSLADFLKNWNPGATAASVGFKGAIFEQHCNMVNLDSLDGIRDSSCDKRPAYYCDDAEQRLLDAAKSDTDAARREATLKQLMRLNAENSGMLFLVELVDLTGLHRRVQGFRNDNTRYNYHEITLAR